MSNVRWVKAEDYVAAHFAKKMPKRVKLAAAYLEEDLYHGPMETYGPDHVKAKGYPSTWTFKKAAKIVSDWSDKNLNGPIYYDSQTGEVTEHEPEGFEDEETGDIIEPIWDDWFEFDRGALWKAVFGKEVAKVI